MAFFYYQYICELKEILCQESFSTNVKMLFSQPSTQNLNSHENFIHFRSKSITNLIAINFTITFAQVVLKAFKDKEKFS